jgi:hypothetical protein
VPLAGPARPLQPLREPRDRGAGRPTELGAGEGCWGEQGMRTLWDASDVKVFAGGVSDLAFLEGLSQLNGECASGCPRPEWVPLTGTPIATASLNGLSPVIWMSTWVTGLMTSLSLHSASNSHSGSPK